MPDRILRAGILDSKAVNALSDEAEVLYRRLFSVADDFGRYEADPEMLRVKLFWRQMERWDVQRVARVLDDAQLRTTEHEGALVRTYEVGGKPYLEVQNFGKPKAKKSKYPEPPWTTDDDGRRGATTDDEVRSPQPPPNTNTNTNTITKEVKRGELDALWLEFKTLYPAARLKEELTCRAFLSRDDEAPAILAGLRLAVTSEEWTREGGKFVPSSERFITDGRYKDAGRLTQPGAQASTCESTMDPETARRLAERRACANQ